MDHQQRGRQPQPPPNDPKEVHHAIRVLPDTASEITTPKITIRKGGQLVLTSGAGMLGDPRPIIGTIRGLPVNGLMPLRALVAFLATTENLARPRISSLSG